MSVFFILYVNKIILIKNNIPYIIRNKGFIVIIVLHKDLEKASLILEINIYRDRSKSLFRLSQSMHIEYLWVEFILSWISYMRSDMVYLLEIVSRYLQDPDEYHQKVILKYFRNTKDRWLDYGDLT